MGCNTQFSQDGDRFKDCSGNPMTIESLKLDDLGKKKSHLNRVATKGSMTKNTRTSSSAVRKKL